MSKKNATLVWHFFLKQNQKAISKSNAEIEKHCQVDFSKFQNLVFIFREPLV